MGFAADLETLAKAAKENAELVVRKVALDLGGQMVERSPVGNPDLWAPNKDAAYMRETYNLFAGAINADLGKKRGRVRLKGKANLAKSFPNVAGKGYVGGRFKNNWITNVGAAMDKTTTGDADSSGSRALAALGAKVAGWKPGDTIWITNSLPYAQRLEYGWSKQAPGGMVRLAVQDVQQAVARAAKEVRG